jgi:hypothetical protein
MDKPVDAPDTSAASNVTDHAFVPVEGRPWDRCALCKLSQAVHADVPVPYVSSAPRAVPDARTPAREAPVPIMHGNSALYARLCTEAAEEALRRWAVRDRPDQPDGGVLPPKDKEQYLMEFSRKAITS